MNPGSHPDSTPIERLATIDVAPLLTPGTDTADVATQIDRACRELGFFRVTGHGVDPGLLADLDRAARAFFARSDHDKEPFAMANAGAAWRGWFPLRGEITSGRPDRKEGLYVGIDHADDHPLVMTGAPLHGRNLLPDGELRQTVDDWLAAVRTVADAVMQGIALGLGLPADWFERHVTSDPTVLFRIFQYPALDDNDVTDEWGVGEHTDYGLLTLLAQDDAGGLEVRTPDGRWLDVPAEPGVFVCNLGDMLDRLTEGRYRSTPHRVRNTSGRTRLSFPYFFDPSWDAQVVPLPLDGTAPADDAERRWDGASLQAWSGRYGDYLMSKVSRVFPELFAAVADGG
ncbi:MAG: 2-oxoglutarate and iron-dependent oxygenase domain-containing protein [Ilumatobacteraceae bacterium]|nr:2-oxoglutarate and iron-dependent oxygenase domain-containing protein [Ilumatobacteraceae bacterium]